MKDIEYSLTEEGILNRLQEWSTPIDTSASSIKSENFEDIAEEFAGKIQSMLEKVEDLRPSVLTECGYRGGLKTQVSQLLADIWSGDYVFRGTDLDKDRFLYLLKYLSKLGYRKESLNLWKVVLRTNRPLANKMHAVDERIILSIVSNPEVEDE